MNYTLLYQKICKRGQNREKQPNIYYEKHHIIPKCLGGLDCISNITILTAREHFIVHKILCKIYANSEDIIKYKLASAFNMMCIHNKHIRITNSKHFQNARIEFSKNHPMKNGEIKNKTINSIKKQNEIKRLIKIKSLPFCKCGCGNKVKSKKTKYLYNHWDRKNIAKGFTPMVREHLSKVAKQKINSLSKEEKQKRLKNSLHSSIIDHKMRGSRISISKKGKPTNQQEIMGKKFASMTEEEFECYLQTKSYYVWNRFRKLRILWKKKI